jgi:energy-coupling factor transporter transmembrane protein EcfT
VSVLWGAGIAWSRSWIDLAACAVLGAFAALRVERRPVRTERVVWGLAAAVFLAHALFSMASGERPVDAMGPAAQIALRLLALLYLLRWASRTLLERAARWLLGLRVPTRARWIALPIESARHALALVPLAVREAEFQHDALRARGIAPAGGLRGRARYVAAWLLPFLSTMLRLGECYADALAARGYRMGAPRRVLRPGWGWPDAAAIAGGAATAAWLLRGV